MPIQVIDTSVVTKAGTFTPHQIKALMQVHLDNVPDTLLIEARGSRLIANGFVADSLKTFIEKVCKWGGYDGIAARVIKNNSLPAIRQRFLAAMQLLSDTEPDVGKALDMVDAINGLGISFASKHLRFLRPNICPVLDSVISEKLDYEMTDRGYRSFAKDCLSVAALLENCGMDNPLYRDGNQYRWFAADVEMSFFAHLSGYH